MASRLVKRHDDRVMPWARFLDEAGLPIDLTGASVVYTLQDQQTGLNKILRAVAIVRNQTSFPGEVLYQFTAADVDTVGYYSEEWEVSYSSGTKESFPVGEAVTVTIQQDLDSV